jgi:hypothetical protein
MLLAYNLPVSAPLWIGIVGAAFAIVVVKQLYGGIGKNFLNPALAARAFLFSWPVIMTTWTAPRSYGSFWSLGADAVSAATPMASLHFGKLPATSLMDCFLGYVGGSMGEVSAAALLLGGLYLMYLRLSHAHPPELPAHGSHSHFPVPRGDNGRLVWMATTCAAAVLCWGLSSWHRLFPPVPSQERTDHLWRWLRSADGIHPVFRLLPGGCELCHPHYERRRMVIDKYTCRGASAFPAKTEGGQIEGREEKKLAKEETAQ